MISERPYYNLSLNELHLRAERAKERVGHDPCKCKACVKDGERKRVAEAMVKARASRHVFLCSVQRIFTSGRPVIV